MYIRIYYALFHDEMKQGNDPEPYLHLRGFVHHVSFFKVNSLSTIYKYICYLSDKFILEPFLFYVTCCFIMSRSWCPDTGWKVYSQIMHGSLLFSYFLALQKWVGVYQTTRHYEFPIRSLAVQNNWELKFPSQPCVR